MAKKVVLVTGAAIGIGRAVAFEMAKSGCRVIINYNTHKKEAEDLCAAPRITFRPSPRRPARLLRLFPSATPPHPPLRALSSYSEGSRGEIGRANV